MIGLIAMCFLDCDVVLTMAVFCVSAMLSGAANSGLLCSHQDLAPNLAGTLLGITNSLGALAGVANPALSSFLLQREVCICHFVLFLSFVLDIFFTLIFVPVKILGMLIMITND